MNNKDKRLGMNQPISRRDFINGIAATAAVTLTPTGLVAANLNPNKIPKDYYPPSLTGMRGNHDGSFTVAHKLALEGFSQWGKPQNTGEQEYDLIVVGGGISGLAAAHFYAKEKPNARILILENHDDFGGHAKRNEFKIGDDTLIGHGGSQTMVDTSFFPDEAKTLLADLGIKPKRFETAYDQNFYKRNKLRGGLHFDKETWGKDTTVALELDLLESYIPVAEPGQTIEESVAQMPISKAAQKEFLYLMSGKEDIIPHIKLSEKWQYLSSISYKDFLVNDVGIKEQEVLDLLDKLSSDSGNTMEVRNAYSAIAFTGLPGWDLAGLNEYFDEENEPYICHFPDGNASVARMIIRRLIPEIAPGNNMDDIVLAKFDYSKLDQKTNNTNVRLNSTVINVGHISNDQVSVTYIKDDTSYLVKGKSVILACFNSAIPHICPELPESQKKAQSHQVRLPVIYTNVVLKDWSAWKKMGFGVVYSPTDYYVHSLLNFPVSMGGYQYAEDENQPVIIQMQRFPTLDVNKAVVAKERRRIARYGLLTTTFEDIERETRAQLNSMMAEGGFDAAKDILGITVNRWSHGYSYFYDTLTEPFYEDWNDPRYPHVKARQQRNRISIANSDASAIAMFERAIEQGHRAAYEQLAIS